MSLINLPNEIIDFIIIDKLIETSLDFDEYLLKLKNICISNKYFKIDYILNSYNFLKINDKKKLYSKKL